MPLIEVFGSSDCFTVRLAVGNGLKDIIAQALGQPKEATAEWYVLAPHGTYKGPTDYLVKVTLGLSFHPQITDKSLRARIQQEAEVLVGSDRKIKFLFIFQEDS